ncbi:DUF3618 domain-containing protein [Sphaerimonospora thailandensis]|uniref:DUF3618 domain-containing protein n=1 Tax=Sphaerimonospora thailandensis TaxID=795644 RepID=A0A8J3VYZ9_9ACTN|nr:DUF3618 domain-containing protein [Sphaerimonospora thailandensis]GIH70594.1 hypothetical protein Mth01_28470 [Sphaerimonospora thailandensis]
MADTDPDALERQIERTRAELARTVDAIADRVSPKRVAEREVAKAKANAKQFVTSFEDLLRGHPRRFTTYAPIDEVGPPRTPSMGPLLIGIGAAVAIGAAVVLLRRRAR